MVGKTPIKKSEAVISEILKRIAEGDSLVKICSTKDMPSRYGFLKWLDSDADLVDRYARARENQADYYADEIINIADTEDDPQKARVRIDARKWHASKMKPKTYGDSVKVSGSGENGEFKHSVDLSGVSSSALDEIVKAFDVKPKG